MEMAGEAPRNCPLCPRLAAFRAANIRSQPSWYNGAVPSFGRQNTGNARLLIVGLAPGLRGANRTGRPFTGDFAGDLLYATLLDFGFAQGRYEARPDDSLVLVACVIANAVRCVPPENKPTPAEITTCRRAPRGEAKPHPLRQFSLLSLQHEHRTVDAGHVSRSVCQRAGVPAAVIKRQPN
jgi:uracil-DNA glycosylase